MSEDGHATASWNTIPDSRLSPELLMRLMVYAYYHSLGETRGFAEASLAAYEPCETFEQFLAARERLIASGQEEPLLEQHVDLHLAWEAFEEGRMARLIRRLQAL